MGLIGTDAAGVGPFYLPIPPPGVGPFCAPITSRQDDGAERIAEDIVEQWTPTRRKLFAIQFRLYSWPPAANVPEGQCRLAFRLILALDEQVHELDVVVPQWVAFPLTLFDRFPGHDSPAGCWA